jgi:hypothetical protein
MQIECFHQKMLLNLFFGRCIESLCLYFFLASPIHQLHYYREYVLHNLFFYTTCEVLMSFLCYFDEFD